MKRLIFLFIFACQSTNAQSSKFQMPKEANYPLDSLYESKGIYVDRINGFMVRAFRNYSYKVSNGIFRIYDNSKNYYFISGFMKDNKDGSTKKVLSIISKYIISEPIYKDEKNTRIIILEMNFPYELLLEEKGGVYKSIITITSESNLSKVSMIIFPKNSNPQKLNELEEIAKSFRIIPVSERIVYSYEIINDPSGMPAMFIAVPENWKLSGSAIKSGSASWSVHYHLTSPYGTFLRMDNLSVEASGVMNNAQSVIKINGNSNMVFGFVKLYDRNDCINSVFNYFWNGWKLDYVKDNEKPSGIPPNVNANSLFLKAVKNDTIRYGFAYCFGTFYQDIYSSYSSGNLTLITMNVPSSRVSDHHLLVAILNSIYFNPEWVAEINRRFTEENRRLNQITQAIIEEKRKEAEMFRNYLRENREISENWQKTLRENDEFVSELNTAWSNLLGEKIYVKDPGTGEIFRLDDKGGDFYKEPTFGTIIENVPKDYELQKTLNEMGFQKLPSTIWKIK